MLGVIYLLVISLFISINCEVRVTQDEYTKLPKVYDFNITDDCPEDHVQCRIAVQFEPTDKEKPSRTWQIIEQMKNDRRTYFRRDLVYRGGCVDKNNITKEYTEHMTNGLVGKIQELYCISRLDFFELLDPIDIIFGLVITCYLILIVVCTINTHNTKGSEGVVDSSSIWNNYFRIFSVVNIWKAIMKPNRSEDFEKQRSLQGMRSVAMLMILLFHCFVSLMVSYSINPEYAENVFAHPIKKVLIGGSALLVEIFFIMSAWLLAVKLLDVVKKNSKLTFRDVLSISFQRYCRLIPAVIIVTFLQRSAAMGALIPPLYHYHFKTEQHMCAKSWWKTLLLMHNLGDRIPCPSYTWYVAADFQMYISVCLLFYISQRWKVPMRCFLQAAVILAMGVQVHNVMNTEFDGMMRINPRFMEGESEYNNFEFTKSYCNTINHITTYAIGFTFGAIYCRNKEKIIFDTLLKKILWCASFFGLPFFSAVLYSWRVRRILEAIMTITLRPIFGLGIAVGLLGMTTKTGGWIRNFFQWTPLVFFGGFTYSIFSFNFFIIFGRMMNGKMGELSDIVYLKNVLINISLSYVVGTMMYIIMEHPCSELQKFIVLQFTTKRHKTRTGRS